MLLSRSFVVVHQKQSLKGLHLTSGDHELDSFLLPIQLNTDRTTEKRIFEKVS